MSANNATRVLFDAPGPRGRRRILIGSIATSLVIAAVLAWALYRFAEAGQFEAKRWEPFVQPGIPKFILTGLWNTLKVTAVAAVFAFPLGALVCLLRLSQNRLARWTATAYIEIFRSTPLLLLVYLFVGGLPALKIDFLNFGLFWKITIPVILCNVAVLAEVFRAGVRALPRGQSEAGYSIGLTYWQTMRSVVMPQAIRIVIPALVTQLVSLLKDSTLGFAASYAELMKTATNLAAKYHNLLPSYITIAVVYIVINLLLSYVARLIERRMARGGRARTDKKTLDQIQAVELVQPPLR